MTFVSLKLFWSGFIWMDKDKEEVEPKIMRYQLKEQKIINFSDPIYFNNTSERDYIRSILTNYIQEHLPDGY